MKKRLLSVLSVITLVVGCGYFITGKVIQKNYYDAVAKINAQNNIKLNIVSYNRGFISSKVDLEVVSTSDNPETIQVLPLRQAITHGPIVAVNTPKGFSIRVLAGVIKTNFGEVIEQRLAESTASAKPLEVITLVSFSNKATTWVSLTAVNQTTPTQFHVQWQPIIGEIVHDLNFASYTGTITIPEVMMSKPGWQFKVNDLAINLDTNSQNDTYFSSQTLSSKSISFSKQDQDVVTLNDLTTKLTFVNKADNLELNLETSIANSKIAQQQFSQDQIRFQANFLNRDTLQHLPSLSTLSPKATIDFVQSLTRNSTELVLELPKPFTEALLSYVSFEMYRSSPLGKFDKRPEQAVLLDITGSINKLIQGAVKQRLFLDKGNFYALNYERPSTQG